MQKLSLKTDSDIESMARGGKKLAKVKNALRQKIAEGISAFDIDALADELIKKEGGEASFKKVPGYSWASCVNVNDGLVHGIPKRETVFKKGDLVSVDVGMYFEGFHTDTSFSVGIGVDAATRKFLTAGEEALEKAISQTKAGNYIGDISRAIQETIESAGFTPIKALVGHGVGRGLHEDPQIPCFVLGDRKKSPKIVSGMALAIEVMYTLGRPDLVKEPDGWTISTADGKISALFEETVAVTSRGPVVLTR